MTDFIIDVGLQGPRGLQGFPGTDGEPGPMGQQGITGTRGSKIFTGAGAPPGSIPGILAGDYYIDTTGHFLYGPWSGSAWPAQVAFGGPQGPAGATGATGPAGPIAEAPTDSIYYMRRNSVWTSGDAVFAKLASPTFTGTPQAPTVGQGSNDTSIATTAWANTWLTNTRYATAAQYLNNTANLLLVTDRIWTAAAPVTLTDGATVTPDFSTGIDFTWTLGAAGRTLANPTNTKNGQKGVLYLTQDGTGNRTITTWGSAWKFPGGTKPTLTTAANAIDTISYAVKASGVIACAFSANYL